MDGLPMSEKRTFYGHRMHDSSQAPRAQYLTAAVHLDVWVVIQRLRQEHGLSISGAAHHLMRIGAGLKPLYPFNQQQDDQSQ